MYPIQPKSKYQYMSRMSNPLSDASQNVDTFQIEVTKKTINKIDIIPQKISRIRP